jgi:hypothetical protein
MSAVATRIDGPAPEAEVVRDMARRGLMVSPLLVGLCAIIWSGHGAISSAYGIAVVLLNFALAAFLITTTARISLGLMMGAALFGYLIRLGLIFCAWLVVRHASWFSKGAFGLTIIVTHLGLLIWETRFVSASLAFPGLKPPRASTTQGQHFMTKDTA